MPNGVTIPKSEERTKQKRYLADPALDKEIIEGCEELKIGEGEYQYVAVKSFPKIMRQLKQEKTLEQLSVLNGDLKDSNSTLRKVNADLWIENKRLRTESEFLIIQKNQPLKIFPLVVPCEPLPELQFLYEVLNQERIPEKVQKKETEIVPEPRPTIPAMESEPEEKLVPCDLRLRIQAVYYCVKKPPEKTRLETLQICKICLKSVVKRATSPRELPEQSYRIERSTEPQETKEETESSSSEENPETTRNSIESDVPTHKLTLQERAQKNPNLKHIIEACQKEEEDDSFDCEHLCKRFPCTNEAIYSKGEIRTQKCYEPKYPRYCEFMGFQGKGAYDLNSPYVVCLAKQTDVSLQLPKDRLIKDAQFCWRCMVIRKKQREEAEKEKQTARRTIRHETYPNQYTNFTMGNSEGYDTFNLGDR